MSDVLVLHAGAIGDLVQTLPTLRAVRADRPDARITLLGRPNRAVLAQLAGVCDAVADLETAGLAAVLGASPPSRAPLPPILAQADLVLDFLTRGALAARLDGLARPRVVSSVPLPPEGWTRPAAEWIFEETARHLDLPAVPQVPEIPIARDVLAAGRRLLADRGIGGPLVAIHPGSGSVRKNWPPDRFAEVAARVGRETGRSVVWLVGPAEQERGLVVPARPGDVVLADLPLDSVAAVLAAADAYLGNDSGTTQIAAAVRRPDGTARPVVVLFGPTDPDVWAPRGDHVRVVRSPNSTTASITAAATYDALRESLGT